MIELVKYDPKLKGDWDGFIRGARHGVFLFYRDYMDYHSDRFADHSLMFYKKGSLIGLLPGSVEGDTLVSHGGLTFGGVVSDFRMTVPLMLDLFGRLLSYLKENRVRKLIYKAVPYIYLLAPAAEDRYALFIHNAKPIRTDITSTIFLRNRIRFQERRERAVKKARGEKIAVKESGDYEGFMAILTDVLKKRYDVSPAHSSEELTRLARLFPQNIKLFVAEDDGRITAGVLVYENREVAHAQYIAGNEEGRKKGALDLVFDYLINERYKDKSYFDFGISNEREGRYLNAGLMEYKESFGARAVTHDFFEIEIT